IAAIVVVDAAYVEHWNGRQPPVAAELQPALLQTGDRAEIADAARGDIVEVLIVTTDELVQIEELRGRDLPRVQRTQAVLHANVVKRSQRKSRARVRAVYVLWPVVDGGTQGARIGRRVVS